MLCVFGYTTLLRKIRVVLGYIASLSLLCELFKIDSLKLDDLLGVLFSDGLRLLRSFWPMRFLSMRARMSSQIFWSSASTFATTRAARCPFFSFFVCNSFFSVSNLSCRLGFLPSLDNLLDLNLHLVLFVLRNSSLQSKWLLQRSVTVCCLFCCFCATPFFNSASFYSSTSLSSLFSTWCSLALTATFNSCSVAMR